MARIRTNGRRCRFESLENRQMLAGNVTATVGSGSAIIRGDNWSNGITIGPGVNPREVVVTGVTLAGAPTSVNGVANGAATLINVTKGLNVSMAGGHDSVTINNLTLNGKAVVKMGDGLDDVQVTASTLNSSLKTKLGKGADTFLMANTTVLGKTTVKGGNAHDAVTFTTSNNGALKVGLGKGNDVLSVTNTVMVVKSVINGGSGINYFNNGISNFYGGNNLLKKNFAGG